MVICEGRGISPLKNLENGADCTWFIPSGNPQTARKRWISGSLQSLGCVIVDDGALAALERGRSLLPAGISRIVGNFQRGDAITIMKKDGSEIGRGLIAYSADDATKIIGHKTGEIENLLGYRGRDEIIHRDDLVIF